ncbi:MAG: SIS domain-containing protein [Patescibacteria group bacterium]
MRATLFDFPTQLKWQPIVEGGIIPSAESYLLCGMGGSALAGGLLTACDPTIALTIHRDYGLPILARGDAKVKSLVIISSFSGNTEETLDAYRVAMGNDQSVIVVTSGGELLDRAKRGGVPYILLPDATIQPRLAVGYFLKALASITGAKAVGDELESLAITLDLNNLELEAQSIASRLVGRIPLIYSSNRYAPLAYFWKIMLNETAKIPAFSNVIPEQNHNELESFDGEPLAPFTAILLTSEDDDEVRVARRFEALSEMLSRAHVPVELVPLTGATPAARVVCSLMTASFTALALAEARGVNPSVVSMIEDFKRQIVGK